jgi:hypothetical protein
MLMKALDLLRTLGWYLIHFIFTLIDSLFQVLKGLNTFDIVNSVAKNSIFDNFQIGIFAVALTLLGLFAITRFIKKIIDPDDGMSTGTIYKEIAKCGVLIILSTFLFVQASTFSIKLSGYTASIFESNDIGLSNSMLSMFIQYEDDYPRSDDFKNEDIQSLVKNGKFDSKSMYNDKFTAPSNSDKAGEQEYKFNINWIMATIVGAFFLYSLFFSGMMLARRQIEFLFLFIISPIIFATSVGNKNRRQAVVEQLVSLMLQGAVIMLIIALTAIVMQQVNSTTFFDDSFKDVLIKSIMYIGCGSFLLTGSQVVNRFIGGNVSANSGREQLMAMMGFGHTMGAIGTAGTLATAGASLVGAGALLKGGSKVGSAGNSALAKIGHGISSFGSSIGGGNNGDGGTPITGLGGGLQSFGNFIESSAHSRANPIGADGLAKPNSTTRLNRFGTRVMNAGTDSVATAIDTMLPMRGMYRRRYRGRGE